MKTSTFSQMLLVAAAVTATTLGSVVVADPMADDQASDKPADNTANNKVDNDPNAVTPLSQSNDAADIEVTRKIRRSVVSDSSLSTDAQNVKIITTAEHMVYLRGAVASREEVKKIVAYAKKDAGHYKVKNPLSVTAK